MKRVATAIAGACWGFIALAGSQANQPGTPAFTGAQAEAGRSLFASQCAPCHGSELQGAAGPALSGAPFRQRWFTGQRSLAGLFRSIAETMPPDTAGSLTEAQVLESVAFILQRNGLAAGQSPLTPAALAAALTLPDPAAGIVTKGRGAAPQGRGGQASATAPVPRPSRFPAPPSSVKQAKTAVPDDKELLDSRAADWLLPNQDVRGQRFSALKQIDTSNVGRLVPTCMLQMGELGGFQTRPIVYNGRLYLTTTHKTVAVDAVRCTRLWEHTYTPRDREPLPNNRGVALYRGKVYRGTGDGHLLALDAETGELLWDVWVADSQKSAFVAASPLAIDGKVFVGEGGGDFAMDGKIHAFDAETGRHLWMFNTIAKDKQSSWPLGTDFGGGGNWIGLTYDPAARVVFSPVGNPYPNFPEGGQKRPGDNLYTNSVVALDMASGQLLWHVQQEPHDVHDWDTGAAPTLYDIGDKRFMAVASKNGFLYLYDRDTHGLLAKVPVSRLKNETAPIPPEGIHVCPGFYGGVSQNGQAYDPVNRMLFLGAIELCGTFFPRNFQADPIATGFGWIRGYDAATGKEAWATRTETAIVAGVTPTAGGVLFTGDLNGLLLAYDSKTGKELYRFNTGGPIAGGIVTYEVNGKQYVAVPAGNVSTRLAWTRSASPTLVVFALP